MLTDERIHVFLDSLEREFAPFLEEIYQKAEKDGIPVVKRETAAFLHTMVRIRQPERILEIGTAVGFSALLMASAGSGSCRIITLENYRKHADQAAENFEKSGMADRIQMIFGDADETLDMLEGPFDLVFMDAAKGRYIHFLPKLKKLMKPGSILIADNVFSDGDVLESRFAVRRRDRTIHKRLRQFLRAVKTDEELDTAVLPLGDGVTLSVMRKARACV